MVQENAKTLIEELVALSQEFDEKAMDGSLNNRRAILIRQAARHIARIGDEHTLRPEVPDNISPVIDDMIALGVSSVSGILKAKLTKMKDDKG